MKPSTTAVLTLVIGFACFAAGRWQAGAPDFSDPREDSKIVTKSQRSRLASRNPRGSLELEPVKLPGIATVPGYTVDEVRSMTPAERLALLKAGATTADGPNQIAVLTGVISILSKDELVHATELFEEVQARGNGQPQAVWEGLWKRWGAVDPIGGLAMFKPQPGPPGGPWYYNEAAGIHSGSSARCLMSTWLETDPAGAMAWARKPQDTPQKAAAAALALVHEAGGDPERLESSMRDLDTGSATLAACMKDYVDLASIGGGEGAIPSIYEKLPSSLQRAAWPVVMKRLVLQDPSAACEWLRTHANEPGQDYGVARRAIAELASADPEGTVAWTALLPAVKDTSGNGGSTHPAVMAIHRWMSSDPASAKAWLQAQPRTAPWYEQAMNLVPEEE